MRVLHLNAYALRGGCENDCHHFINGSKEHSHEIIVLGKTGPMTEKWESANINVNHLDSLSLGTLAFIRRLKKTVRDQKYDCVIYWSNIKLSSVLYALNGCTENVLIHLGNPFPYRRISHFKEIVLGTLLSKPANVVLIGCSNHVTDSFKDKLYFRRFKRITIYNPISIPSLLINFRHDKSAPFKIGMVARLDPIKNHPLLLEAFEIACETDCNMELNIVGGGKLLDQMKLKASLLKCSDRIIFHGESKLVYDFLRSWDMFVYSTTAHEGLGNAVTEALANGLPMVLPDLPMMREIGQSLEGIWWYSPADARDMAKRILEAKNILNDEPRRIKISKALYDSAQRFSPQKIVAEYLSQVKSGEAPHQRINSVPKQRAI